MKRVSPRSPWDRGTPFAISDVCDLLASRQACNPRGSADAGLHTLAFHVFDAGAQVADSALVDHDHAALADAHPATERHQHALVLAGLQQGGRAVDGRGLPTAAERHLPTLRTRRAAFEGETFDVQVAGAPASANVRSKLQEPGRTTGPGLPVGEIGTEFGDAPLGQLAARAREHGVHGGEAVPGQLVEFVTEQQVVGVGAEWTTTDRCAARDDGSSAASR